MKIYVCTAEDYDFKQLCGAFYNEDQAKEWAGRQHSDDSARKEAYREWLTNRTKAQQAKFGCTYPSTGVTYQQLQEFNLEYGRQIPQPLFPTGYGYGYEEVEVE